MQSQRLEGSRSMSEPAQVDQTIGELRQSLAGSVLVPADAGYDQARRAFNLLVDRRPAVIVRCLDDGDIVTAFDFARSQGLEVAVRGGGHNPAGHCVCDGGLVIDLSPRLRPLASSHPEGSSVRPASPVSRSAEGSGT